MKKFLFAGLAITLMVVAFACKSAQKNKHTNVVEEVKPPAPAPAATVPSETNQTDPVLPEEPVSKKAENTSEDGQDLIYAFTASFYSIGEGTDGNAINSFKSYIETFNKSENVVLAYVTTPWGREGEVDYCFVLEELSGKQRAKFIEGAKKLFTEKSLVHLNENGRCHPKRR